MEQRLVVVVIRDEGLRLRHLDVVPTWCVECAVAAMTQRRLVLGWVQLRVDLLGLLDGIELASSFHRLHGLAARLDAFALGDVEHVPQSRAKDLLQQRADTGRGISHLAVVFDRAGRAVNVADVPEHNLGSSRTFDHIAPGFGRLLVGQPLIVLVSPLGLLNA